MLFASIDLAARIERAECRLLTDGAAAVSSRLRDDTVFVQPIAAGIAILTVPGSPLNKLAGLGFGGPVDEDELAHIENVCRERNMPLQVELSNLAESSIGALLTRRGYAGGVRERARPNVAGGFARSHR
jgi:hypothetical protein